MKATEELLEYLVSTNRQMVLKLGYVVKRKPRRKPTSYGKIETILKKIPDESTKALSHGLLEYDLRVPTNILSKLPDFLSCLIVHCELLDGQTASAQLLR